MRRLNRLILWTFVALAVVLYPREARANQSASGWCMAGATIVVTSGLSSSNQMMGSFPQCLVTVSIHGAGLATIYADNALTPLANPFVAQTGGQWQWYATNGHYDVTLSGAGMPTPVTYSDIILNDPAQLSTQNCIVTFSATPTFTAGSCSLFVMTLTGNVTSSTISGGITGQIVSFSITQGAGGPWTLAWPASFLNPPLLTPTAAKSEQFTFVLLADGLWHSLGTGESLVFDTAVNGNILRINGVTLNAVTGTGAVVLSNSPTITGTVAGSASYTSPTITGTVAGGASYTSPTITGIVAGGASYTAPTITSPVVTGTESGNRTDSGNVASTGANTHSGVELFGNIDKTCVVDGTRNATIAAAITDCGANSVVYIPKGTYTLAATLAPQPNQELLCDYGATITEGTAANLNTLVTFDTNTANGASLVGCTLDGNQANQTFLNGSALLNIGKASNVLIQANVFQNSANVGLNCVISGSNPRIIDNFFTGVFGNTALSCLSTGNYVGGYITHNRFVGGANMGVKATGISVDHNTLLGYQAVQTVNTNGTGAVAFNSGTNFSQTTPGMFIRINGSEYVILSVGSNTALTIQCGGGNPACPATHTGYASIIGAGDLIGLADSSYVTVTGNTLFGGMGYGIVMGVTGSAAQDGDAITDNTVAHVGGDCINVYDTGAGGISNVAITGNSVVDCGIGAGANPGGDAEGIHLFGPSVSSVVVDSNSIVDDGTSTVGYCVYLNSVTSVVVGVNVCTSPVTGKVFGANLSDMTIGRVRCNQGTALGTGNWALGGNWGTSPSILAATGYDGCGVITVTSGSGSPGANPTVTLTFVDGTWTSTPTCVVSRADASLPVAPTWTEAISTTQLALTFIGTPNTGQNYTADFWCSGK